MVEFTDIPNQVKRGLHMTLKQWVFIIGTTLLLSTLSWGADQIPVGNVEGMEIKISFSGDRSSNGIGEMVFSKSGQVLYQIIAENHGSGTFSHVEIQSSLRSDGSTCAENPLSAGVLLPGSALSSVYNFSLSPGDDYNYDAAYTVPPSICTTAYVQIRIQYRFDDRLKAVTLISPIHLRFE